MAQGAMIVFDTALLNMVKDWDDADTYKFGIVTNATVPTRDTAAPHWGGTGTTNFATNQVATGGTSYTGPVTLSGYAYTEAAANTFRLAFTSPSVIAQDASGFTDGYWMVAYNDTDANKRCLFAIELGGPISIVGGSLTITFNANGIFQIT